MKTGLELITNERQRQIDEEGWTPEHDDQHKAEELKHAACCYAVKGLTSTAACPTDWPWDLSWWKPSDNEVRNWTKAGALFLAERDRQERLACPEQVVAMDDCSRVCAAEIDRLLWIEEVYQTLCQAQGAPTSPTEETNLRQWAATLADEESGYYQEGMTAKQAVAEELSYA